MTLLVGIIIAIIVFCIYHYFYAVKENFDLDINSLVNDPANETALPLSDAQQALMEAAGSIGIKPVKREQSQLSRILEIEGLCSNYTEPLTLKDISSPLYPGEGCGWYYYDDPAKPSFPAYGNPTGPLNPQLSDVAKGGQWYFGNSLVMASKKETVKRCKRIRTCQIVDLYPGKCAWCEMLGYGIPIDPDSKRSLYPEDDMTNCQGKLTYDVEKCPVPEKLKTAEKDEKGNIVEPEP